MVIKVAGGILGIGLIGTGGIAVAKPHWLGMDYMPTFHALSKDNDFSENEYASGKLGNKFKNYLVGVTNKKNDQDKNNQSWWEWAFRQLEKKRPGDGKFSKLNGSGVLKQACKEAYKKSESDLKNNDNTGSISESDFKKSDFWKYCSPLGKEPEKVGNNKYQGQIGSTQNANFASVDKGVNEMFWIIREKEVRGNDDNFAKVTISNADSDTYFKNEKTLRELCEEAYEQSTTGGDSNQPNPNADTTKKYCAISISQS